MINSSVDEFFPTSSREIKKQLSEIKFNTGKNFKWSDSDILMSVEKLSREGMSAEDLIYYIENSKNKLDFFYHIPSPKVNKAYQNFRKLYSVGEEVLENQIENDLVCPRCRQKGMIITIRNTRAGDEAMTVYEKCPNCSYTKKR